MSSKVNLRKIVSIDRCTRYLRASFNWYFQSIKKNGQSQIVHAFRNLKNPYHLALKPQFHGTDQKIKVHFFMCVIGYILNARRDKGKGEGQGYLPIGKNVRRRIPVDECIRYYGFPQTSTETSRTQCIQSIVCLTRWLHLRYNTFCLLL